MLTGDPQRCAAGDQHLQRRAGGKEVDDERSAVEHLLQVIEQEQSDVVPKLRDEALEKRALARLAHAERACNDRRDQSRIGDGSQRGEGDAVQEGVAESCRRRQRETGFADTAGAGQG